jgi:predicted flap endonuclease-1-like 5' DNA nuclease
MDKSDLPLAIGKPAIRWLSNAGITRLKRIAKMTDKVLLSLHGVGPKAVRILRESLAGPLVK